MPFITATQVMIGPVYLINKRFQLTHAKRMPQCSQWAKV